MPQEINNQDQPAYVGLIRGGRLTKCKGIAASIAPMMSAAVMLTGVFAGDAFAANECGISVSVTCTAGAYAAGIDYSSTSDMTLTLDNGGMVVNGQVKVFGESANAGDITVNGTSFDSITTTSSFQGGALTAQTSGTGAATVTLSSGYISTAGQNGYGLQSVIAPTTTNSSNAMVTMSGGTVETIGDYGYGIYSYTSGTGAALVELSGGEVWTTGDLAYGIDARTAGIGITEDTKLDMSGGSVTTTGFHSVGIYARNYGTGSVDLTLSGGDILTEGDEAQGVISQHTKSLYVNSTNLTMTDGTVTTLGDRATGLLIYNAGLSGSTLTLDMTGGSVDVSGANSNGIEVVLRYAGVSYDVTVAGDASVTGGSGTGTGINTISVAGSTGKILIGANAEVDGSAGAAAIMDGAGDTVVSIADGAVIDGAITLGDGDDELNINGGLSSITLLDGGDDYGVEDTFIDALTLTDVDADFLGANIINWEQVNLDGGVLRITDGALQAGDGTLGTGLTLTNGSRLDTGAAFALTGNLTTSAGGTFDATGGGTGVYSVNGSVVNDGIITTQDGAVGDEIMVAGDYTGTGALLVDVDFASDTFDRLVIEGNATGTTQVDVSDVTTGVATGNDLTVLTVGGSVDEGAFVLASGALAVGAFDYDLEYDPGAFVLRSQGVNGTGAVYEALPAILGNFNRMSTLEQRVGQRQWSAGNVGTGAQPSGSWLRLQGNSTNLEADTGTTSSIDTWGLQAGIDFNVEEGETGQWVLGVTGQYGSSNASVANALGFGDIGSEGYGLGLTATWYGNSGTYFDAQGQVNWISSDVSSSTGGSLATDQDSTAYALSAEVGHRFKVSETGTWVPQAQLVWGQVDSDSFTDNVGNAVDLGSNDSLVGRLGLAYEYDSLTTGGNSQKLYAIANIIHDFEASNSVDVAGATLTSDAGQTWGEIGVGGSLAWDESKTLYGEVSYAQSFDSSNNDTVAATAGLRIQW